MYILNIYIYNVSAIRASSTFSNPEKTASFFAGTLSSNQAASSGAQFRPNGLMGKRPVVHGVCCSNVCITLG